MKVIIILSLILNVFQVLVIAEARKHIIKLQKFMQPLEPIEFDDPMSVPEVFDAEWRVEQ